MSVLRIGSIFTEDFILIISGYAFYEQGISTCQMKTIYKVIELEMTFPVKIILFLDYDESINKRKSAG